MDYGKVIKDAWNLTWRHPYLWILGFFVGGGVQSCGSGSSYRFDESDYRNLPPESQRALESVVAWVQANIGLLIALAVIIVILSIVYAVVSFIAQGGLTRAGADLRRGIPCSPRDAWRYGVRFFWRYVGLFFLVLLFVIGVTIVLAILGALFFGIGSLLGKAGQIIVAIFGVIFGIAAIVAFVVFAIGLGIVVNFAQRSIAIDDVGVFEALQRGVGLLRRRIGPSLVFWLLQIVLSIGAFLVTTVALAVVAVPLALLGALIYLLSGGMATGLIAYGIVAALIFIVAAFVVGAIVNTFFWNYWTFAYMDLTAPEAPIAPPTPPTYPEDSWTVPPSEPTS